ncbi:class I SAM-dependent methyltransferase [Saccharopolyspora sp. HNM0983]|uniref:Class I SAM-dependent methyltransferase n=1 Tax=Saccharopolyspora montiporae TaxID=2781240 RepID=A0A929G1W6_9PSEU|nr:class I SAM-dependent methyltransferase [Saccharopolyspora sp. HNM0983]
MDPAALAHRELDFNAPLADQRVDDLITALEVPPNGHVLDLGCGWGEFLLRLLQAVPSATGTGVDLVEEELRRGEHNAAERGLRDRVRFVRQNAAECTDSADIAICIASDHAFGGVEQTVSSIGRLLRPGGRLLLGTGVRNAPGPEVLGVHRTVAELVDLTEQHGMRSLRLATASTDEWDSFESRWCGALERWLLEHPTAPEHAAVRRKVDEHRRAWLREYRDAIGFAYLVLTPG